MYLAEELKLRDPATYLQMKETPWLDNIIRYGRVHLGQNTKRAIKSRKTPTTDLHLDAVWELATKRDPATQLDLCEQRSKTTLEGTVAQKRFPTVATKYLARPLSHRRIRTVRPLYEKVQVPSRIFPVDRGSAGGILPVGITAIRSEGAEGVGALGHTSGCPRVSSDSSVLLIHEGS